MLVSFKNILIWPSCGQNMAHMPIFGHLFFGHNSAIFWLIGLKISMGTQETIIYRLVVRNLSYVAYFLVLIFLATFAGKWARPPCARMVKIEFYVVSDKGEPQLPDAFYFLKKYCS